MVKLDGLGSSFLFIFYNTHTHTPLFFSSHEIYLHIHIIINHIYQVNVSLTQLPRKLK